MRALRYAGAGDVSLETSPVPLPSDGEVLLRVACCGVCGSDLAEYDHGPILAHVAGNPHPITGHSGPVVLGHEFSGFVAARGAQASFELGTLVACSGGVACGRCPECEAGRPNLCLQYHILGMHGDGGLAEFCAVPSSACADAGQYGLGSATAALAQPMAIAVHAVRRAGLDQAMKVCVVGVGGIGAFLCYAAVEKGAQVTAFDLRPERLDLAKALGAASAFSAAAPEAERTGEFDVVFEVSGASAGLELAQRLAGRGGTIVVTGLQHGKSTLNPRELVFTEQTWIGSMSMDMKRDLPEALRVLSSRAAGWADLAPAVLPLEAIGEDGLIPASNRDAIKTLFAPHITEAITLAVADRDID
jgi:(R,R)-butanediol dehydrogenase / meso-butanediol dehydrogenase / diacetyl reductase